ncbi:MAG: hypothetical protein LBS01_08270 [Prevotellaceae bacterium]|jgi:hypothetical protein|nr:hypothetical protein [Prevotellaceae bacterium]
METKKYLETAEIYLSPAVECMEMETHQDFAESCPAGTVCDQGEVNPEEEF